MHSTLVLYVAFGRYSGGNQVKFITDMESEETLEGVFEMEKRQSLGEHRP